ncbi:flagellar export protein FliJ [Virgibacillus oceani]|uniref:Flagellar FliJ protein n=1 Tax=Virgibacillus oceani TaxID=1479511 RepID=A0A917M0N4_9BACI|nr:flagellar export protein FliJ [Virgibacillus oceani]GGG69027.1 flagellar FliJ protein [Virgibacillus oceani]
MTGTVALSKILHVRENEKLDAQKAYHHSMELFEEIALQLYNLLRKKEAAEESYEGFLQRSIAIDKIKEQATYIERINKQINVLQASVQKARSEMETRQEELTHAHVEVKKFEKIMEHRRMSREEEIKKIENATMDELSIQQYLSHGYR